MCDEVCASRHETPANRKKAVHSRNDAKEGALAEDIAANAKSSTPKITAWEALIKSITDALAKLEAKAPVMEKIMFAIGNKLADGFGLGAKAIEAFLAPLPVIMEQIYAGVDAASERAKHRLASAQSAGAGAVAGAGTGGGGVPKPAEVAGAKAGIASIDDIIKENIGSSNSLQKVWTGNSNTIKNVALAWSDIKTPENKFEFKDDSAIINRNNQLLDRQYRQEGLWLSINAAKRKEFAEVFMRQTAVAQDAYYKKEMANLSAVERAKIEEYASQRRGGATKPVGVPLLKVDDLKQARATILPKGPTTLTTVSGEVLQLGAVINKETLRASGQIEKVNNGIVGIGSSAKSSASDLVKAFVSTHPEIGALAGFALSTAEKIGAAFGMKEKALGEFVDTYAKQFADSVVKMQIEIFNMSTVLGTQLGLAGEQALELARKVQSIKIEKSQMDSFLELSKILNDMTDIRDIRAALSPEQRKLNEPDRYKSAKERMVNVWSGTTPVPSDNDFMPIVEGNVYTKQYETSVKNLAAAFGLSDDAVNEMDKRLRDHSQVVENVEKKYEDLIKYGVDAYRARMEAGFPPPSELDSTKTIRANLQKQIDEQIKHAREGGATELEASGRVFRENPKYQAEMSGLGESSADRARRLGDEYTGLMLSIRNQALAALNPTGLISDMLSATFSAVQDGMNSLFEDLFNTIGHKAVTFKSFMNSIWDSMKKSFASLCAKMVTDWLRAQAAMAMAGKAGGFLKGLLGGITGFLTGGPAGAAVGAVGGLTGVGGSGGGGMEKPYSVSKAPGGEGGGLDAVTKIASDLSRTVRALESVAVYGASTSGLGSISSSLAMQSKALIDNRGDREPNGQTNVYIETLTPRDVVSQYTSPGGVLRRANTRVAVRREY